MQRARMLEKQHQTPAIRTMVERIRATPEQSPMAALLLPVLMRPLQTQAP
jgi:hypothetical protein